MSRYFIELSYLGTAFSGFQVQHNAPTIQAEVERALGVYLREKVALTGSSRTDAGVHGEQNYFHFDTERDLREGVEYNINSLLPGSIAVRRITRVAEGKHCRFDAIWRQYRYVVYREKDPFREHRGYYFPYAVDIGAMKAAAAAVLEHRDFTAFAKRNSQVKTMICTIGYSDWEAEDGCWIYRVRANRFLRGMVRGLVGTMLKVGRGRLSVEGFVRVMDKGDAADVDFAVPGGGLYLEKVTFPDGYFD